MKIEQIEMLPEQIEKKSFEIITKELGEVFFDPEEEPVIKRVIHTTADFDYAENLVFSKEAVGRIKEAVLEGVDFVTDTQMAKAGINKKALSAYGCQVHCFMGDEDVAAAAGEKKVTRAAASVDKAVALGRDLIFVIGNAPTALIRLHERMEEGLICPRAIIAVPVGFVNVEEGKELILKTKVPYIVARGRKGGSNVAAAIVNAIVYNI